MNAPRPLFYPARPHLPPPPSLLLVIVKYDASSHFTPSYRTPLLRLRLLSNNGSLTRPLATAIALLMPASPTGRTHRARGKIMSFPQKFTQQTHPYGLPVLHPSFCSKSIILTLFERHDLPRAVFPLARFGRLPLAASRLLRRLASLARR